MPQAVCVVLDDSTLLWNVQQGRTISNMLFSQEREIAPSKWDIRNALINTLFQWGAR